MAGSPNPAGSLTLFSLIAMGEGPTNMSQISRGIFGAIAISLTLGAIPFAAGRDLTGGPQDTAGTPASDINRAAKADREAGVKASAEPTRTILLRLDSLSDTSVLVRIPVAREARSNSSAPLLTKPSDRKMTVACEPMVSTLTELATQLQPGRCVT
jgi:hypothetical protein